MNKNKKYPAYQQGSDRLAGDIQRRAIRKDRPAAPAAAQRTAVAAGVPESPGQVQAALIGNMKPELPGDFQRRYANAMARTETLPGANPPEEPAGFIAPEPDIEPEPVVPRMTRARLAEAMQTLIRYRAGKSHLESRLIEVEQWWKMRHWPWMQEQGARDDMKTASAWLFNVIVSKHADGVQSVPEANILPREEGDKATAKRLSAIIPCILEQNGFDEVYSDVLWQKLKGGTGAYGVFWDPSKLNGLGDVAIRNVNLLHLFWEPGVSDIQHSRNVFHVEMVDSELLKKQYPQLSGMDFKNSAVALRRFITEDSVDSEGKTAVVDWYYHGYEDGRKVVHFCKFVGETLLYATEDDPLLCRRGLYDHGQYPFVLDPLFPVEGSPCGFGYIDVCKNAQEQIDVLNQAIVKNSLVNAAPRYFVRADGSVNEKEFMDFTKPVVHVTGNLGADSIVPIATPNLDAACLAVVNNKIAELKETSGNTDSSNGVTQAGVQAASAIAALQEASGKISRAASLSAYRAFTRIVNQLIELIRQFYDLPRQFRITGEMGREAYVHFENSAMQPQSLGDAGWRMPIFDVRVSAQTRSAYSKNSRNELALALYNQGVFNPQMTDQAVMLLDMMDFDGKETLMQKVSENGDLYRRMAMYQQIALDLAKRYEPDVAQRLAQTIMGGAAADGMLPEGEPPRTTDGGLGGNITKLNLARQRAREASRPDQ